MVTVKNNTSGINPGNVFLYASSATSSGKLVFSDTNTLSSASDIGVALSNLSYTTTVSTGNATDDYLAYIHPDNGGVHFAVSLGSMNCHKLTETAATSSCKAYWNCATCSIYYSDNKGATKITDLNTWKNTPEANGGGLISGGSLHTHVKGTYVAERAATCTTKGNVAYYQCTGCSEKLDSSGSVISNVETAIVATAHKYGSWQTSTDGKTCVRRCGYNTNHIETTNHTGLSCSKCNWKHSHIVDTSTKVPAKAANCATAGNVEYYLCSYQGCQAKLDANGTEIANVEIPIDTSAHSIKAGSLVTAKEATCTEKGNVLYYLCSGCDAKLDASGNEIANVDLDIVATAHSYGAWEQLEDGTKCERTCKHNSSHKETTIHTGLSCSKCGWQHTHSIKAGSMVTAKAATCTEKGNVSYYLCSGCDAKLDGNGNVLSSDVVS